MPAEWVKELAVALERLWIDAAQGLLCSAMPASSTIAESTTHWQDAQALATRFPKAKVEPDLIYVRDGRADYRGGCDGGDRSGLALVGRGTARRRRSRSPSGWWSLPSARADSPSLVPISRHLPIRNRPSHASRPCDGNIGDRHTLESLAAVVGMSPRNLDRQFRAGDGDDTARLHRARPR